MTRTAIAGHVTVDQLIDTKQVVALACAAHSLSPVHDEISLGEFRFEGEVLAEIRRKRLFGWDVKDDPVGTFGWGIRKQVLTGGEGEAGRWEMAWAADARALPMMVGALVRANNARKRIELAIFVESRAHGPDRGGRRVHGVSASHLTSFVNRKLQGPFSPLFLRASGMDVIPLADYRTLGHGDLRTVSELFAEFAKDRPLVQALANYEKLSPFRPERAWGYFVPEPLQPALLEGWRTQLADFKKCL
jgi:hypothetical protein